MTGIFASIRVTGKTRCARCGRPFTPKSEGQDVGPTCARKLGGLPIYVKDHHGGISAVIV